jgi:hypothetical protein
VKDFSVNGTGKIAQIPNGNVRPLCDIQLLERMAAVKLKAVNDRLCGQLLHI